LFYLLDRFICFLFTYIFCSPLATVFNKLELSSTVVCLGGYPDNPGSSPSKPGGLSRRDCVVLDNFPHALCFAFRTDNSGPPANISVCSI